MNVIRRLLLAIAVVVFPMRLLAQGLGWDYQEQARTHNTDVEHIEMHISFDEPAKKVFGTVYHTLQILPQVKPVDTIVFDAVNLNIQKVWIEDKGGKKTSLTFDTQDSAKLRIHLDHPRPFMTPFKIGVEYWVQPKKGLWFIAPDTFYTTKPEQIWTQGEGEENRNWLPTYDYPNDKATTDMFVTVRADQMALSNGKLVGKVKNKDGTVTWHWNESHPFSTYLIMLGIGHYETPTDKWRGKNVEYWVYPGWSGEAHRIFGLTPDMIEFYSNHTGFAYPWEKYSQIAIADFMYGGMENVTATTENDYVMYDKRAGVDFTAEGLIAHELAHQWFGDLVTCRSWLHTWLNESFATYFEALYRQHHDGQDEFEEEMQGAQNAGINAEETLGKKPIIAPNNYTANHYPRGAATLNMMRHVLGDSGWRASIHHYLDVHQFQPVVSEDFKMAIEEATGQNLAWFFDEWLYKSGHPVYDVNYTYDDAAKQVQMTVVQTQKRDTLTGTFKMPIDIELTWPDGSKHVERVRNDDSVEKYTFAAPGKPLMVIFDKGNTIIKELHFHKGVDEWLYQLEHGTAIERSQAAMNLSPDISGRSDMAFRVLKARAFSDPFWAVRLHVLNTLASFADANNSITDLLIRLVENDPRPDVRALAVQLLGRRTQLHLDQTTVEPVLLSAIDKDSSYNVVGSALKSLNVYDPDKAYSRALGFWNISSPRDRMRQSVVDIVAATKTHPALDQLIAYINTHNIPKYTRTNIVDAISEFTSVDSTLVYRTLWNLATMNGDETIRHTALNRLADIGDANTLKQIEAEARNRPAEKAYFDQLIEKMKRRLK